MLNEICKDEALPIGWILHEGHHLSCSNGHSYGMTAKTMAVGNSPENDGPDDAFMVTPVPIYDETKTPPEFIRWDAGPIVEPLPAPYNCPECNLPLGIK